MNQSKIWLVVKPTVGLPLFLGTVATIALLVHAAVLTHTDWFSAYWQGGAKVAEAPAPRAAATPAVPAAPAVSAGPTVAATAAPVAAASAEAPPVGRVFFAVDKSDAWVDGGETLVTIATYLKAHDAAKASISGYHDASGNKQHNQELAKARAIVVRDALVANGVPTDRLVLEKPIETTGSGDPRDARRVEVTVQP